MKKHYEFILKDTQELVYESMCTQIMDEKDENFGAFMDRDCILDAKYTIYRTASMISLYCCKDSELFRDEKLFKRIMAGLGFAEKMQLDSGLYDYVTCNFSSAPDTAFCIKKLMPIFFFLRDVCGDKRTDKEEEIYKIIEGIIRKASRGIMTGGFHTPNHRWAIASTLMECYKIYGDEDMKRCAERYLAEGIDCNEDGEYAEKSAGNYNRVNNDAMITLAEATGDKTYEEYVIRNLRMMLHYWEPDDSVFTANSTRFDKDRLMYPTDYYTEYMLMAQRHGIPEFYEMCNYIIDVCKRRNLHGPDCLIYFMWYPEWINTEHEGIYKNSDYQVFYQNSGISRNRTGRYTYTVMKGKSNFLYFHNGTIKLEMKVAGSFCEHRAFKGETMEETEEGLHLHQTMHGWYYLPWSQDKIPETNDWWQMENEKRDKKMGPDMDIDVWVKESKGRDGINVRIKTKGVEGAPWRIEMSFTGADFLENSHMATNLKGNETIIAKDGEIQLSNSRDTLIIGPCFGTHRFMEGKEDSEATNSGSSTIYFTDYTGFDHTIMIRNMRSQI
ncbi:hypothetical protein [Butyrivibrio sp. XBB1001]|uniref:hypothetical protein n=1 Tax=Butyrivibrio sp. XBB1001 TaxID=1280682 RepID=UPI00040EE3EE|nr:hypothetical protein [Butyrivibrio sp. XBB1001]